MTHLRSHLREALYREYEARCEEAVDQGRDNPETFMALQARLMETQAWVERLPLAPLSSLLMTELCAKPLAKLPLPEAEPIAYTSLALRLWANPEVK